MRIKFLFASLLIAFAQSSFGSPQIQHWTTENGVRVYFVAAPELPIIDIQVVFDAGGARDQEKSGLALLTNGLMAEGAGGLDANTIAERFEQVGAQFGNSSQRDMSLFTLRSLTEPNNLQPALANLSTVINLPEFPQAAFDRERNRLLRSIEKRKQSPGSIANEAFYKALFNDHPYAALPAGQEATIKALKRDDLKKFYQQYFVAKNAVVAIVGQMDKAKANEIVTTLLGRLPPGKAAVALPKVNNLADASNINIEHPSAQTHIIMGQPGLYRGDPDYYSLYVGNHILGGSGLVSRLSDEIREKRGLSYSTYSYFLPMRKTGPFILGLQTKNESAAEATKVLREEVKKFVTLGPSKDELEAAKKNITGGFPLRISSNKKILSYVAVIGFYGLPLDYLQTFNNKINTLTVDKIKDAFQRRVHPDKLVTVMVGGKPT